MFGEPKFFATQIFWDQIFLGTKFFFGPNFFGTQFFFRIIFQEAKFFATQIFWDLKFSGPKFFGTQFFQDPNFYGFYGFGHCLVVVWMLSGGCLEGVSRVSGRCRINSEGDQKLFGTQNYFGLKIVF